MIDLAVGSSFLKKILLRLLTVLITLAILLVFAEFATRFFTNTPQPLLVNHPIVGATYIPNYEGSLFVPESQREVDVRFTKDGFRGENRPYAKPPNTRRIALIGDSQIAAIATPEAQTLAVQLEKMLQKQDPKTNWEVLNFGVSGASTGQELVLYREVVSKYDPDLVICAYFVGNDFSDNCDWLSWHPRIYLDTDADSNLVVKPFSKKRKKMTAWLNRYSRFYVWQKHRVQQAIKSAESSEKLFKIREGQLIFMDKNTPELNKAWQLNERLIKQFHKEVKTNKQHFICLVLPDYLELYPDAWTDFQPKDPAAAPFLKNNYPRQRLDSIFQKRQIPHIFAADSLRQYIDGRTINDTTAWIMYGGKGHLNEKGQAITADVIYQYFMNHPIVK